MFDVEIAYIQKQDGEFINSSAFQAWEGFKLLGIHTEFFQRKQIKNGHMPIPLTKSTLVTGHIGSVKEALKEIGVVVPIISDYPVELETFFGRKIWTSTLGDIRKNEPKVFIKPKNEQKLFTGHVRTGAIKDLTQTALCPDDTEIYVSEPVKFVSEYRVFVNQGLMVGCQHYVGDFTVYPNFEVISNAIDAFRTSPIAYSADFGVTDDGTTLLVEINDAWALGSYGLPSILYAQLIINRWEEIVNG